MPDSEPQATPVTDAGGVASLGIGERLRSARKARALTLEQAAESLHLDESVILALEEERFDALGAPVFVRGHLRAYARLLELPPDPVLAAYRRADPDSDAVPAVTRASLPAGVTFSPLPWAIGLLGLLLAGGLAFYVLRDAPAPPAAPAAPPLPVASPGEGPRPLALPPVQPAADLPAAGGGETPVSEGLVAAGENGATPAIPVTGGPAESAPEPPAEVAEEPAPEPVAAQGSTRRLGLIFRAESWVEISDRNRRLLFGLQREGLRRELVGEPPFRVLIGNLRGVDVYLDDQPFSVPPDSVNGNIARFVIDARRP